MKKLKKLILIVPLFILLLSGLHRIVFAANQVVENGIYEIEWTQNNNKVLDISAAEKREGANVQIWNKCNGKQQRFQITYLNDGFYSIKNINSGMFLDVAGAGKVSGTNVWQWTSNLTDAQKWKIEKNSDGSFCIISKCNGLYLSVTGSRNTNGANIEVSNKKHTFNLKKITTI